MSEEPILFAAYAGVLGGAERVLLDCVTRLERPLRVACPPGPLADELRAAGIEHVPLEDRKVDARSMSGGPGWKRTLSQKVPFRGRRQMETAPDYGPVGQIYPHVPPMIGVYPVDPRSWRSNVSKA